MLEQKKLFESYVEKGFSYADALKRLDIEQESITNLRNKVSSIQCIPKLIYDKHLIMFLSVCKGDIEEAAKHMKKYYELKVSSPELFWNRDMEAKNLKLCSEIQQMAELPITPSNNYVFINKVTNLNPKVYFFDDVYKMFMMMAEKAILASGPRDGAIFISDWTGVKFGHLFRASVSSIRKSFEFIQYASPIKVKAVHILNSSPLIPILFAMCKPFMRHDFIDLIHIHTSDLDYEEFFEKHVPRMCMPSDYGGDLPTLDYLHSKNTEKLLSMKEYFHLEEQHMQKKFDEFLTDE